MTVVADGGRKAWRADGTARLSTTRLEHDTSRSVAALSAELAYLDGHAKQNKFQQRAWQPHSRWEQPFCDLDREGGQSGWARESSAHRITRSRAAHSRARVRYTPTRPSSWCLRQRMAISSRLTGCQQSHLRQVRPHPRLYLPQYGRREVGRMQTMSHHGHDTRPKLCCAPMAVTSRRHLLLPAG